MYRAVLVNCEGVAGISAAVNALRNNASPLDAVEIGIRIVERVPDGPFGRFRRCSESPQRSKFNAAIIEGATLAQRRCGVKGYRSPISVARQVMERTPHVLLAGDGAARFAAEIGADSGDMLSPEAQQGIIANWVAGAHRFPTIALARHARWWNTHGWPPRARARRGTTTFLVQDADGHMAGGVSTSGLAYKYPGRVGDSCRYWRRLIRR